MTQDELAQTARQFGLKWTASKVRDFESGRSAPTFATVLALTAALNGAITRVRLSAHTTQQGHEIAIQFNPVRLADLVSFAGQVTITEELELDGAQLADFCRGGTWEDGADSGIDWVERSAKRVLGLTEERVAAGLGVTPERVHTESLRLWNTTFSAQRDRLAGPDANRQRKGRITRQLKAQLQKAITDGDD